MTGADEHPLVVDYLDRLERATAGLPAGRGLELVAEIRSHLADALGAAPQDEPAVRAVLDRMGSPAEIVAAETGPSLPVPEGSAPEDGSPAGRPVVALSASAARPARLGHELAALLMLTLGSFVPVVGWLIGVLLLWTSRRWSVGEKLLGTLVVPFGPASGLALAAVGAGAAVQVCTSGGNVTPSVSDGPLVTDAGPPTCTPGLPGWLTPVALVLLAAVLVAPFLVAAGLYRRARRRAEEEDLTTGAPSTLRSAGVVLTVVCLVLAVPLTLAVGAAAAFMFAGAAADRSEGAPGGTAVPISASFSTP